MELENKENIILNDIESVLHNSMMPYSEYIILERTLPRVEDGLKPVQRRILYAMNELGLTYDKPYKKSARVVGECLAKYHPHGDTSVYDAMVRLAQPFNMRMPLVDGQGNYGSVDGDNAAAMRYTEARLNPIALEMLRDIDKDTVDWQNNFDDTTKEPKVLPSRFPNILVNGAMGIAIGLATNIPPHNLAEVIDGAVAYIDNSKIKLDEMLKIVKGPDFPTGGYIIAGEELEQAYATGKGKIIIRSKINIEKESNGRQSIVVTEIPYQVNKAALIEKIGRLMEDKKEEFGVISDVVDESDRHGMRIVIKLKKDINANDVLDLLYKYTDLQISFGINMVMIADGKPQQLGLLDILKYYTEYQKQVVLRRTKFDLQKAKLRYEIVEGLIIAVTNIDKVIKIIKNSSDTLNAKQNLRKEFNLSDVQAQAILDLKLSRLTKLEIENLKDELVSLKELIKNLTEIIDSKRRLATVVKNELLDVKKRYKDARRTVILGSVEDVKVERFDDEKPVLNYVLGYSAKGLVRKVKVMSYSRSKVDKPSPSEIFLFEVNATSNDTVYAFTDKGNCYRLVLDNIPEARGAGQGGVTFDSLFKEAVKGEIPVAFFNLKENEKGILNFFTKYGTIKGLSVEELNFTRSSTQVIKLKDNDSVISVQLDIENKDLFYVTSRGICMRSVKEIPVYGKASAGVKGITLDGNDFVISVTQVDDDTKTEVLAISSFGTYTRKCIGLVRKIARGGRGVKLLDLGDSNLNECLVYANTVSFDSQGLLTIIDRLGVIFHVELESVVSSNKAGKGATLPKIGYVQPLSVYYVRH